MYRFSNFKWRDNWALIISVIVLVMVFLPHGIGLWNAHRSSLNFNYIVSPEVNDLHSYQAWIYQAAHGEWLFSDLYTSESSGNFFAPIFLLIGILKFYLEIPVSVAWYLGMLATNGLLLCTLHSFINKFTDSERQKNIAFTLAVLGAGLGWLLPVPDYFQPEMTIFQILRWPMVFSLALSSMLWALYYLYEWLNSGKIFYLLGSSMLGLILIFIHPYDIVTYYRLVLIMLVSWFMFKPNTFSLSKVLQYLLIYCIPLLGIIYYFWLFNKEWVFAVNATAFMQQVSLLRYLLALGVLAVLGFIGLILNISDKK